MEQITEINQISQGIAQFARRITTELDQPSEKLALVMELRDAIRDNCVSNDIYERARYGVFYLTEREHRDALLVHGMFYLASCLRVDLWPDGDGWSTIASRIASAREWLAQSQKKTD